MINLESEEFKKFVDEIKKVLAGTIEKTSIENLAASQEEITEQLTKELGEEKRKELFVLSKTMDKRFYPEQKVDFLTNLTVTKQENRFNLKYEEIGKN